MNQRVGGTHILLTFISSVIVFVMIQSSITFKLLTSSDKAIQDFGAILWVISALLTCYITLILGSIAGPRQNRDSFLYILVGLITIIAIGWMTHQNPLAPISHMLGMK